MIDISEHTVTQQPTVSDRVSPPLHGPEIVARLDRLPILKPHVVWIALIAINLMIEYYDNGLFIYIAPALQSDANLTTGQIGTIGSAFFVGMLLGALVGGRLADRFGRRTVLVCATVLYSLASLMSAALPEYEWLLASRIITGIGVQAATSVLLVYIAEMFPAKSRGRFVAVATIAFTITAPILGVLSLFMLPNSAPGTWRYLFLFGAIGLLIAPAIRFLLPESVRWQVGQGDLDAADKQVADLEAHALREGKALPEPVVRVESTTKYTLRELAANKKVLRLVAVVGFGWFGATLGLYMYQNWSVYVLIDSLRYSETDAYTLQFVWSLVYALTPLVTVLLIDRVERKTLILWSSLASAAPILALGLATSNIVVAIAGGAAGILTGVVFSVYYAYIPETMPTEARGLGTGVIFSIGRLGGVVSGVLGALIYSADEWGLDRAGLMIGAAAIYIVSALVVFGFGPRTANKSLEEVSERELTATT
ncbi:MFS transporter [Nocardia sp. NPDC002869]|uniref:MFS transporter n=1 Tax=Nocardia sp. NPDC002869 TaxID=3161032 RepID=UPI00398CA968